MTEIKKETLSYKRFNNLLNMFKSSSSEDFFLALQIYKGCKKNKALNTIIARHIGKGKYVKSGISDDNRELHKRLLEFTKIYDVINLDLTFHKLINEMIKESKDDKTSLKLVREEVLSTINTLIDYHGLINIIKIEAKNIKI